MKTTMYSRCGAVVGASVHAPLSAVALGATSHLADAVRLLDVDLNVVGRGMWRGQPPLGIGMSNGAPAAIFAVPAGPAAKARKLDRLTLDRRLDGTQFGSKQLGTTVYEGPRPWKVPV